MISEEEAKAKGLYNVIGKEIDEKYLNILKNSVLNPNAIKEVGKDIKIVYTPLHGTGNTLVEGLLKDLGFENVYVVPEQARTRWKFSNSRLSKSRRSKSI